METSSGSPESVPPPPLPPPVITPTAPPRKSRGWMVVAIILFVVLLFSIFGNITQFLSNALSFQNGLHTEAFGTGREIGPKLEEFVLENNRSANKIAVHGHTLIWGNGKYNPPWIRDLPHDRVAAFIDEFIRKVVGHYRGRLASWDVVNEPTSLGIGSEPPFQHGPFYDALGSSYVARCFRAARAADPKAILVLNEAQTERDEKVAALALLEAEQERTRAALAAETRARQQTL